MPFGNAVSHKQSFTDPREKFVALASMVVREPVSTHIVKSRSPSGRIRYLIVDRAVVPREDGIVVLATASGLKVSRYKADIPLSHVWGTVVWYLQQG
jgi:hypothetical protein